MLNDCNVLPWKNLIMFGKFGQLIKMGESNATKLPK